MDHFKYARLYKNNTMKRCEDMKAASNQWNKQKREASRHKIRQSNRNMSDSDGENEAPANVELQQNKRFRAEGSAAKNRVRLDDDYLNRLQRLREFQERKQQMQLRQALQKAPFIPYVMSSRAYEETASVKKKAKPLPSRQWTVDEEPCEASSNSPAYKFVKPRVDCWLKREPYKKMNDEPAKKLASVRKNRMVVEPKKKELTPKPITVVRSTKKVKEPTKSSSKPLKNFPLVNRPVQSQSALITSTARKSKKPLTFTFGPSSGAAGSSTKNTLTVADADSLFDGISPIDKDPSPRKSAMGLPKTTTTEGDSIWEPQPVAAILEATGIAPDVVMVNESPVCDRTIDGPNSEPPINGLCVCEIPMEGPNNKAPMNESFTICYNVDQRVEGDAEDSIFGCRPVILPEPGPAPHEATPDVKQSHSSAKQHDGLSFTVSNETAKMEEKPLSKTILSDKTFSTNSTTARRRSSLWSVTVVSGENAPSPDSENVKSTIPATVGRGDTEPTSASTSLVRKRSSILPFKEDTVRSVISPSVSNLTLAEAIDIGKCISQRRSSSSSSSDGPVAIEVGETAEAQDEVPPREVLEKTNFYYGKVDSELARLQALCSEYEPFLEQELNDHCRGLIIAAQGQTNILIKKKLTKFRDLIGHYQTKWNDQKVRNDDLDGFWLMLSLDLENLDKRFAELRALRANNWQEAEPEPPPKTKKLQAGGGIKKRPKNPASSKPSSSIAEMIRKARQEKQKQKAANVIDLGTLAETVTLVTTPVKKSVRIAGTPKRRSSPQKRSSLCTGCTPTLIHWEEKPSPSARKRQTIFPEITQCLDTVKSILKTPRTATGRRAKSVLFLDSGLDTPQTRRRQSARNVVDTPKPKIKFNHVLEIEHIDNLAARTPSRLDEELQKRRRQSLFSSATRTETEAEGSPNTPSKTDSVKRRNRNSSRKLLAAFNTSGCQEMVDDAEAESEGKRLTRSASKKSRKRTVNFC